MALTFFVLLVLFPICRTIVQVIGPLLYSLHGSPAPCKDLDLEHHHGQARSLEDISSYHQHSPKNLDVHENYNEWDK